MKTVALICNVVLFGFICCVLVTDGPPRTAIYIAFTLWSLLTPILSVAVLSRSSTSAATRIAAMACNVVFFASVCLAFVDRYPHPEEEGFVAFAVLIAATPIVSLVALLRGGAGRSLGSPAIAKVDGGAGQA